MNRTRYASSHPLMTTSLRSSALDGRMAPKISDDRCPLTPPIFGRAGSRSPLGTTLTRTPNSLFRFSDVPLSSGVVLVPNNGYAIAIHDSGRRWDDGRGPFQKC